jgi:hypothetical protein
MRCALPALPTGVTAVHGDPGLRGCAGDSDRAARGPVCCARREQDEMLRALHGQLGAAQRMAGAGPPAGAGWGPHLAGDPMSLGGLRETLGAGLGLPCSPQPEPNPTGAAAQPWRAERDAGAGAHDVPDPDPAAAPGAARERARQEERDVQVLELLRSKARARQRSRDPAGYAPGGAHGGSTRASERATAPRGSEKPGGGNLDSRSCAARGSKTCDYAAAIGRRARGGRRGMMQRAAESASPKYGCRRCPELRLGVHLQDEALQRGRARAAEAEGRAEAAALEAAELRRRAEAAEARCAELLDARARARRAAERAAAVAAAEAAELRARPPSRLRLPSPAPLQPAGRARLGLG